MSFIPRILDSLSVRLKKESSFSCRLLWSVIQLNIYFLFLKKIQNHMIFFSVGMPLAFWLGQFLVMWDWSDIIGLVAFLVLGTKYHFHLQVRVTITSPTPTNPQPTYISKCLQVSDMWYYPWFVPASWFRWLLDKSMH